MRSAESKKVNAVLLIFGSIAKKFSVTLNGATKFWVWCDVLINHCNLVSRLVDEFSSVSAVWVFSATLLQQPFKSGKLFPAYCLFVEMFPTTSVADKTLLANFCPFCFLPSSLLTLVTSINTKMLRLAFLLCLSWSKMGRGWSTAVEHTTRNLEIMGTNPAGCLAF